MPGIFCSCITDKTWSFLHVNSIFRHELCLSIQAKLAVVYYMCVFSGPAHYSPDVKSASKLAMIVSKEDRFKSPKDKTPGPGAYEVCNAYIYVTFIFMCIINVCVCMYTVYIYIMYTFLHF